MAIDDIINVTLSPPSAPPGPVGPFQVDFQTYRTVAFDEDFMCKVIGFGRPIFSAAGELRGWDVWCRDPRGYQTWPGDPRTINFAVWCAFVPEVYQAQLVPLPESLVAYLNERFQGQPIHHDRDRTVREIVCAVRRWIAYNIVPA